MIEVRNLCVQVGSFSLNGLNLVVPEGCYGVLMGKTGSGKTTLLESLCGLRSVVSGEIWLGEQEVTLLKPAQRGIGLVPQDGALFARMTVADHLNFSLQVRRWPKQKRKDRVEELATLLQLEPLLNRYPLHLSGGERQRVALGRALAFRPGILCLDEPLSALDDDTREEMIELLKRVHKEVGVTALHVTHNRHEAEELADLRLRLIEGAVYVVESFNQKFHPLIRLAEEGSHAAGGEEAARRPPADGGGNGQAKPPTPPGSSQSASSQASAGPPADCPEDGGGISSK